jgi:hypothetical protein
MDPWQLMKDCKLLDARLTLAQVDRLVAHVNHSYQAAFAADATQQFPSSQSPGAPELPSPIMTPIPTSRSSPLSILNPIHMSSAVAAPEMSGEVGVRGGGSGSELQAASGNSLRNRIQKYEAYARKSRASQDALLGYKEWCQQDQMAQHLAEHDVTSPQLQPGFPVSREVPVSEEIPEVSKEIPIPQEMPPISEDDGEADFDLSMNLMFKGRKLQSANELSLPCAAASTLLKTTSGKDTLSYHRADRQLIFSEFVEALVRVANAKYPELASLAQRFSVTLYTKVFASPNMAQPIHPRTSSPQHNRSTRALRGTGGTPTQGTRAHEPSKDALHVSPPAPPAEALEHKLDKKVSQYDCMRTTRWRHHETFLLKLYLAFSTPSPEHGDLVLSARRLLHLLKEYGIAGEQAGKYPPSSLLHLIVSSTINDPALVDANAHNTEIELLFHEFVALLLELARMQAERAARLAREADAAKAAKANARKSSSQSSKHAKGKSSPSIVSRGASASVTPNPSPVPSSVAARQKF